MNTKIDYALYVSALLAFSVSAFAQQPLANWAQLIGIQIMILIMIRIYTMARRAWNSTGKIDRIHKAMDGMRDEELLELLDYVKELQEKKRG